MFDVNFEKIGSHYDSEKKKKSYAERENVNLATCVSTLFQTDGKIFHYSATPCLWLFFNVLDIIRYITFLKRNKITSLNNIRCFQL